MGMLNMLYKSLFGNNQNRKMFFRVHILYIDEGSTVYGHSEEQHQANLALIEKVCTGYHFNYTILPLEAIYDLETPREEG
jgi:hypothetical protein